MADIKNREDLERWLKGRPREQAMAIAARAALRVAPLLNRGLSRYQKIRRASIVLPCFYALCASVGGASNVADVETAAAFRDAAAAAFRDAAAAADAHAHASAFRATVAAADAADAAASASFDAAFSAAFSAAAADVASWRAVNADCTMLDRNPSAQALIEAPLWSYGNTPSWERRAWDNLKAHLLGVPEEHWRAWTDWYERRLTGGPINPDLERDRVLIIHKEGLLEKGPAVVNARLAEIEADYATPPEPPAQDAQGIRFTEDAAFRIGVDDLVEAPFVAPDEDGRDLYNEARDRSRALQERCRNGMGANCFPDLMRDIDALVALIGDRPEDIAAKKLMLRLGFIESERASDDRIRALSPREREFQSRPLMEETLRLELDKALMALMFFIRTDSKLAECWRVMNSPPAFPVPEREGLAFAEKTRPDAATPETADILAQAARQGKEGGRLAFSNFLRKAAKIGRRVAMGGGALIGAAWFLVKEREHVIWMCQKIDPELLPILQKIIDALRALAGL